MRSFTNHVFVAPDNDFDVTIVFPSGKDLTIQARPSNFGYYFTKHTVSNTMGQRTAITIGTQWDENVNKYL